MMDTGKEHMTQPARRHDTDGQPKKVYARPCLTVHGTLQEITGNVGNGFVDFPQGSQIAG